MSLKQRKFNKAQNKHLKSHTNTIEKNTMEQKTSAIKEIHLQAK